MVVANKRRKLTGMDGFLLSFRKSRDQCGVLQNKAVKEFLVEGWFHLYPQEISEGMHLFIEKRAYFLPRD